MEHEYDCHSDVCVVGHPMKLVVDTQDAASIWSWNEVLPVTCLLLLTTFFSTISAMLQHPAPAMGILIQNKLPITMEGSDISTTTRYFLSPLLLTYRDCWSTYLQPLFLHPILGNAFQIAAEDYETIKTVLWTEKLVKDNEK